MMGNWPERECPSCGALVPTYRDAMATDDYRAAWHAATETLHHYATGALRLCWHAGDKQRHGFHCSGSGAIVGQPLHHNSRA